MSNGITNFTENPYIYRSLYLAPGEEPVVKYLNGTEAQMEELVHGRIASVGIDEGICLIHNAYAETLKMEENRTVYNDVFYGPLLLVAFDSFGNIISLNDEDTEYFSEFLALPKK